MKKFFITIFSISLLSCSKNAENNAPLPSDITQQNEASATPASITAFEVQYAQIIQDENFIAMTQIDSQILHLNYVINRYWDDDYYTTLVNETNAAQAPQEVADLMANAGIASSNELIQLFNAKYESALLLLQTNEHFQGLNSEDAQTLFTEVLIKYRADNYQTGGGGGDNCEQDYRDSMEDCDTDFAITTAGTSVGAAAATVAGTPIGGAATLAIGMGIAYFTHLRCARSAVREWKKCKYHKLGEEIDLEDLLADSFKIRLTYAELRPE